MNVGSTTRELVACMGECKKIVNETEKVMLEYVQEKLLLANAKREQEAALARVNAGTERIIRAVQSLLDE